ncbi:serine palmitoyltransferase 2-like [Oppia nitens]|uniref:serine palmitoyltransferase 2-like n=1 Tax=Oppia nitens TaxID=1686743 RepID=UPI0023DC3BD2|nr:serine palmitoyltransferase 2-like [Oppia nitens]
MLYIGLKQIKIKSEKNTKGYTPLYGTWQSFFARHIYRRACDAFNQPISSVPAGSVQVLDRESKDNKYTFNFTGKRYNAINFGSYNYLGFAQNIGCITDRVNQTIRQYGVGIGSTHHELGKLKIHKQLEQLFARFLGVDSCIMFGMGFATNTNNIPILAGKGCLILGDQLNHASLKSGSFISGATYRTFPHNNMCELENIIRDAIVIGDPITGLKWKKIILLVEGVYSMEGTICNLPELICLKKKYKCYLYVDEAHSIGAIGPNARGVTDFFGCNTEDIDLMMGTLTKSFGASGGYIAGHKHIIDYIRINTYSAYATNMSAPVVQQIISVVKILMKQMGGNEGILKVRQLSENTRYFRKRLTEMGFIIIGHPESPVIPLMLYFPSIAVVAVKNGLKAGIATVAAGYPATSLTTTRLRLCMSASHTREQLDKALDIISDIGDHCCIKYAKY